MPKANGMFDVVTGTKRSGTSMMMYLLREAGVPIGGFKFPIRPETKNSAADQILDRGCDFLSDSRVHQQAELSRHNINGYWEYPSICGEGLEAQHRFYDGTIIKVFSHALPNCHDALVDRVVYMIRNPRKVLQSRIELGELTDDPHLLRLQALKMRQEQVRAIQWLHHRELQRQTKQASGDTAADHSNDNPLASFKIVKYEKLLNDPEGVLGTLLHWIGRGDLSWAIKAVDARQDRSKELEFSSPQMESLMNVYEHLSENDLAPVLDQETSAIEHEIKALLTQHLIEAGVCPRD